MNQHSNELRYALKQPPLVSQIIEGEVMIINLETGLYYSVTGAGALIWPLLVDGAALSNLVSAVAKRYPGAAARVQSDLERFIDQLVREEILIGGEAPAEYASPPQTCDTPEAAVYPGFGYERFDDMRALLVVDPVHEVGEFGWPPRQDKSEPTA